MRDRDEWLTQNQDLRMDTHSQLFPGARRSFHLDRYKFAEPLCSGLDVLEGACGTGYGTALRASSAKAATGIDCSQESIDSARKVYARQNAECLLSYVEHTPFDDDRFDVVVSFETAEHTLCPQSHMMEIVRILKPAGKAMRSVPNAWGYTDHHFFDLDLAGFRDLLNGFFAGSRFFLQNPPTGSGRF
jgi:2-polyprenyl-3-methyl-5-hydroxy-6-metoxy-1,4-benzoquinol methylase